MLGGALGYTLAPILKSRFSGVYKMLKPLANAYVNAAGYRRVGLKYDDLIPEERIDVAKALTRLTPRESYDRAFRHRVAFQQSVLHHDLPSDQWLPAEEDKRYLTPIIKDVLKEDIEREEWDSMVVERQKKGAKKH